MPERSKGVHSSCTIFVCACSNHAESKVRATLASFLSRLLSKLTTIPFIAPIPFFQ